MSNHNGINIPSPLGRFISRAAITAAIMGVLGAVFYGILGNRADALFLWFLQLMTSSYQANLWPWIIMAALLVLFSIATFFMLRQIGSLSRTLKSTSNLVELDDSLLRILASWVPPLPTDRDIQVQRTLKEVLRDATVEFNGHVGRAAILLPNSAGDFLECWVHYQMPQESIDDMKFYIGSDPQIQSDRGGVAGAVYRDQEIVVGHMTQRKNGHWICDDCEDYVKFHGTRPFPPYRSFVNIPIITVSSGAGHSNLICLGVICFDSMDEDVFDSKDVKVVLLSIARRVAATILICNQLPGA